MTVFGTGGEAPQLGLQLFEGHGLFGKQTNQSTIGQRLTLDAHLRDTCKSLFHKITNYFV